MKRLVPVFVLLIELFAHPSLAQLSNGGIFSGFGVDADTRANWSKYGTSTGAIAADDWFAPSGLGFNVIDTTNASTYLSQLSGGSNITFSQKMASLLYAKVNGKLWIDAVYGRDYTAASTMKDVTTFTLAGKNGDDPSNWLGGMANIPNKNDLADVFAHMRRDGTSVHDSLWFFTGVSTFGTNGSSYYDVELYKKSFTYSATTGQFTTAGTEAGHTQWTFDATGNITQTGDMILAVSFSPGSAPVVDVRIWVSKTTKTSVTPVYFNFSGAFNGNSASPTYGYASIVSKTGATAWGGGISNYSATATQDTTYSTPWGTANSSTGGSWAASFQSQQFIEIGLNLSRIGVDPALYSTLNPCQALFSNIFFKSRSSTSFTSNLQDFMIPLTFTHTPVMDYSLQADTLRCNHKMGNITITNSSTAGYYTWRSVSGDITGSNSDSSQLTVDKAGTYIVSSSPAAGCPATRTDTVIIPIDTFPPVAYAVAGLSGNKLMLYGGDPVASNYSTAFGRSKGLSYAWTGPGTFAATTQNAMNDTIWGTYKIIVTEARNGCTATASALVTSSMFTALSARELLLTGTHENNDVSLQWTDLTNTPIAAYTIERMNGNSAQILASVSGSVTTYIDRQPLPGNNFYRIRTQAQDGQIYYSQIINVNGPDKDTKRIYISTRQGGGLQLVAGTDHPADGYLVIWDMSGRMLQRTAVSLAQGTNTIPLPSSDRLKVAVVGLLIDNRIAFSQKVVMQ